MLMEIEAFQLRFPFLVKLLFCMPKQPDFSQ